VYSVGVFFFFCGEISQLGKKTNPQNEKKNKKILIVFAIFEIKTIKFATSKPRHFTKYYSPPRTVTI
jgi:hypothetical protein